MATQRVLVVTNGSILMASVLSLLRDVDGLDVLSVEASDGEAAAEIGRLAPDVVVLDGGDCTGDRALIGETLTALPRARVVTVDLGRTDIGVYRTRRISRASLNGLLLAIRGHAGRPRGAASGSGASAAGATEAGARRGVVPLGDEGSQEDGDGS